MLIDQHQRVHNYLRISLTDSCNFRCQYCMPDENIQCMPNKHLMSPDEIESLAKTFIAIGVNKIRLTGGEPMVRKEFVDIVQRLAKLPIELTLTTNGVLVHKHIELFKQAGIRSVNVSLDTLNEEVFHQITKRNQFKQVWDNILLLLKNDFRVKINVVAITGVVENELLNFVQTTKDLPLHIRFIEFMPFAGNQWKTEKVLTAKHMLEQVEQHFDIVKLKDAPNDTAKKFKAIGHQGTFAFITTMSEHFCGTCNRMRITADGKMKNCLFGKDEMDLLGALRKGDPVLPLIQKSIYNKHAILGGQFTKDYDQAQVDKIENRSMINIGG